MTDELLDEIERARCAGATVLVKWDSERAERVCTVLVTDPTVPFHFRVDTDEAVTALREALRQYHAADSRGA